MNWKIIFILVFFSHLEKASQFSHLVIEIDQLLLFSSFIETYGIIYLFLLRGFCDFSRNVWHWIMIENY